MPWWRRHTILEAREVNCSGKNFDPCPTEEDMDEESIVANLRWKDVGRCV